MEIYYLLFRYFKWKPSIYFEMSDAEQLVTRALLKKYIEDRSEENRELEKIMEA